MSYWEVKSLGVTFRPIDIWPGVETHRRRRAPFTAHFGSTMQLLGRELRVLNGKLVVVQLAMHEGDFRNDGLPRANARAYHPGVVLAFESKWGPLKYATDEFSDWLDNLRAIALSMEALRKVDRYGVSKRGEQYTGWKQLPSGSDDTGIHTRDQALVYLQSFGGLTQAIKATHPDTGGDELEFRRVMRAKELANP